MKKYYACTRSNVVLKIGDLVMLDIKNVPFKHAGNQGKAKLNAKKVGPFKVIEMINKNVAKLRLPKFVSLLNSTFNVDLLCHSVEKPSQFAQDQFQKPQITDFLRSAYSNESLSDSSSDILFQGIKQHGSLNPISNMFRIDKTCLKIFITHQCVVNSGGNIMLAYVKEMHFVFAI